MSEKPGKASPKDDVGYGRPQQQHQFKPGQSSNPKGRPKGAPTLQEIMAKEATKHIRDWLFNSAMTRFNDPVRRPLILGMHRLASDDLSATLEPNADFVLKLPMIAEKEEKYESHGKLTMHRRPGDVLNPAHMTAEDAAKLKASLPRHVWDG